MGFLYGTEYDVLGSGGRLALIGLVALGCLGAGAAVERAGAVQAARRARAAGWAAGALAVAAWFGEAFWDGHVLFRTTAGVSDGSGAIMLAAAIGFVASVALLRRARSWLVALATAILGYVLGPAVAAYVQVGSNPWSGELAWLLPGAALAAIAEALARDEEGCWAGEALRLAAVVPPAVAALVLSSQDGTLELFAGLLTMTALGAAILRGSPGYALAGGLGLFVVVDEVGLRHFAQQVGFPVVLIASGIALLAVAAGLFRLLPIVSRRRPPAGG
jgi:hypothetical protein